MTLPQRCARAVTGSLATTRAWLDAARYIVRARATRPRPARRGSGTPRLRLLCRTFPPEHDGGVYRLLAIVTAASQGGWHVDVVAGPAPRNPTRAGLELAERIPATVGIHRWERPSQLPIARIAPTIYGGFLEIGRIVAAARRLPAPSVILASGPTFSEFVAARVLSASTSRPYVLDYRDEWTENAGLFVERGLTDRYWERFALAAASAIICVTPGMARHFSVAFGPAVKHKLRLVPNGWDAPDPATPAATIIPPPDDLRRSITFFGVLTEDLDHIGFEAFADDLEQLVASRPGIENTVQFRFVGVKSPGYRQRLASNVLGRVCIDVDHQPMSVVTAHMSHCLGLLILNGPGAHRAIPGKTYGYIAARRPILVYGTGGDTGELFEGVPGARMIKCGDPQDLGRAIDALTSGTLDRELAGRGEAIVESTSRAGRSAKLLSILRSVASAQVGDNGARHVRSGPKCAVHERLQFNAASMPESAIPRIPDPGGGSPRRPR